MLFTAGQFKNISVPQLLNTQIVGCLFHSLYQLLWRTSLVLNAKGEFEAVCNRVSVACSVRDGEFLFERAPEVITTTTTEETEEETGAIPVEGGAGLTGGEVAGEGAAGPEGMEGGKPVEVNMGEGEEGSVLGEQTGREGKALFKSPWFWIVSAGLGIVIISAVKKSKKN